MNQIRLSELLSGKAFHWLEVFVRNIPNTRLESRVIPTHMRFIQYLIIGKNQVLGKLLTNQKIAHKIVKPYVYTALREGLKLMTTVKYKISEGSIPSLRSEGFVNLVMFNKHLYKSSCKQLIVT